MAVVKLLSELYNSTAAAESLLIFYHCLINKYKGIFCKGIVKVTNTSEQCLTMHPKTPYNFTCSDGHIKLFTATQYYLRKTINRFSDSPGSIQMNLPLLNSALIIWIAIFLLAINGVKRLRTITTNTQFVFVFTMAAIIAMALMHGHDTDTSPSNIFGEDSSWISIDFWADMILYTAGAQGYAHLIWLATIKPKSVDPKFAIILTFQIKLVVLGLMACVSALVFQENLYHYMIKDYTCLPLTGFDILLCLIPDIIYRTGVQKLVIPIWYLVMLYFAFITPLYTVVGLVDSIIQRFKSFNRYKLYVCAVICSISFTGNLTTIVSIGGNIAQLWRSCALPLVSASILLLLNMALFFAYSSKSILEDYLFTYGLLPERYWLTFWKTCPIFAIFTFIFVGYNQYQKSECYEDNYIIIFGYIFTFCLLLAVIVVGMVKCCVHVKSDEVGNMSKPADDWGPYDPVEKQNRKQFFPQREMKYRTTVLKCKHRCCCAYPAGYQKTCLIEHEKLNELEKKYLNAGDEVVTTTEDPPSSESVISTDSSIVGKIFY